MKKHILLSSAIILCLFSMQSSAQSLAEKQAVTGSWLGKLNISALSIRVIFNLSVIERDSLVATMDSPDQGAKNIKLGPVTLSGKEIIISAGALLAEYKGTIVNDTLIEGTWTQAGNTFPLNITRLKTLFTLKRPQEPKPPFPYKTEDITFHNDKFNINLAGTITMPEGNGPFPAVILISGSGSQNRDEELLGHKPFLVIADYLTRKGIAVLRFDDRGIGQSQGNPATSTTADLATDAEAAFNYLKTRPEISTGKIGLAGHSEGGLIAPIVTAANPDVAFIISLAGPGVRGEEILHRQNRDIALLMGTDEKKIEESIAINRKLFGIVKKEKDNDKAEERVLTAYKKILLKQEADPEEAEKSVKALSASFGKSSYTWYRYFIITNPAKYWKKVRCPVLALNGEKDLQVAGEVNLPAIEKAVKAGGNKSVTTLSLPGLNHLFQKTATGLPSEYGELEETFSEDVLRIISDWIKGLN